LFPFRLKDQVIIKLSESGWIDQMRNLAYDAAREQSGADQVTLEVIASKLALAGKSSISPDTEREIKALLVEAVNSKAKR